MAAIPSFADTPRREAVTISTANTNRDGTGTMGTLIAAAATGTLVFRITVQAGGTTTAGVIRLFGSNDGGTTKRLIRELLVPAVTPSTTVAAWNGQFPDAAYQTPMILADANDILYVSTNNAETFYVRAQAADL